MAAAVTTASAGAVVAVPETAGRGGSPPSAAFQRTATYPVFANRPAGQDAAVPTGAEISAVTEDGRTLVYTDSAGARIGLLDISDPYAPRGLGTVPVAAGPVAEPTSVAVVGEHALVAINTSASFAAPTGRLDVVSLPGRKVVRGVDLAGQPDSIAVSPDRRYAAIAIENERDELATPPGGEPGDLPQSPPGAVVIIDLVGPDPASWSTRTVALTGSAGSPLPALVDAGIAAPADPEPEYVSINTDNQIAVTLQENNGVVVIDAATGALRVAFSAGDVTVAGIDVAADATIDQTGSITLPREPDAVAWIDDRYLATANEGDWRGGSRTWTVFDSSDGAVRFDSGAELERLAVRHGLHSEPGAADKGVEPEGLAVGEFDGVRYVFVGSESHDFVAVYELTDPAAPVFRQLLPVTAGPEGLLALPGRGLLAVSSEGDDATLGIRSTVAVFALGAGAPAFPSLVSATPRGASAPIGWGALSGLTADPCRPHILYAVADGAYAPTRILTVDTRRAPAVITAERTVTDRAGAGVGYDAEGLYARADGGFWLAVEGDTGPANRLVRLDRSARVRQVVELPAEVTAALGSDGLQGVTATSDRAGRERLWVVLRRALPGEASTGRIGRYDVASGAWAWFGYPFEPAPADGAWLELADVTMIDSDTLAVVERDNLGGPDAAVKRVYAVDVPAGDLPAAGPAGDLPAAGPVGDLPAAGPVGDLPAAGPARGAGSGPGGPPMLSKRLLVDALPALRAGYGWTEDRLEGLAVGRDGTLYAVTDNDTLLGAVDETMLLRLGAVPATPTGPVGPDGPVG